MALKIYKDNAANTVFFVPSNIDPKPVNSLHALANDDLTLDIISSYTLSRKEIANFAYAEILKQDGSPAGSSVFEVVDYLNGQFEDAGSTGGNPPIIESPLTSSVVETHNYRYQITATNSPYLYLASGLPAGLVCNPTTGIITGITTTLGLTNILITAINAFGSDSETLALTVEIDDANYHNTYALKFRDTIYQNYLSVHSSAAINHGSDDSWSISVWAYPVTLRASDLFSQGTASIYRHLYIDDSGRVVLSFARGGFSRVYRTDTSLTVAVWSHVAISYAATPTCVIYFNGVAQAMTLVNDDLAQPENGTANMRIGRGPGAVADAVWLDAYIDEWAYWGKALSGPEVTLVYNAGVPSDLSILGFAGDLKQWLLMGDGDSFPTLSDNAVGNTHYATMVNMTALNIVSFTP